MPPIVDSHLHIWPDDTGQYPRKEVPYPASVELLLEYMAEGGVDHSVFVMSMHYQYDNRILADTLKAHPDKLAGVGVLNPRGQEAADNLEALVAKTDIRGIRIRGTIETDGFCTPETDPLWKKAAELNVPI
ncbi:MAG: amidohydrolase family protein, partial [bacterium]|nr:amidohydrolase family protein [bacterium]